MGCVSSKILAKSGSFQEKVSCSLGHSFQRSIAIEDIILSTSKSNGDQFLALLRTSTSSARKAKEPAEAHSPAAAAAPEPAAKIETIDVSELLAGLEEEESCTAEQARERRQSSRDGSPAPWPASDGGAAGRSRSFRTVEEFDAMVLTQQQQPQTQSESGSSSGRATALATEQEELATATASSSAAASTAEAELSGGSGSKAGAGAKRRARARQLGELNLPTAAALDFSISKSGSLRDWLRQSGQIFSPGSYVTPRFGTSPPAERGGAGGGEQQQQQQALFDPELVAQFERAMEQLSEDEGRVLDEILEALELEAVEKDGAAAVVGRVRDGQPADVAAAALVQQV